ncbi:sensor histidine kinase, partial [Liquorilactobacillus ghanensis]
ILLLLLDYREQKAARWWQRWLDTHLATHDLEQQMTAQQALAASQVKSAALEERIKLSQLIHDEVGHSLSGGLIQMEAAQLVLTKNQQQAADLLDNAIEISRQGIGQIRNLLKNGVPTVEEVGLEKIQAQILEFKRDYHLQTQLTLRGDIKRINGIQWQVLEKNLQEFLTNTLKYADAHQVEIHLLVFNQLLRFTLQNDGVSPGVIKLGLGLRGMQMRAAQLDGQVIFSQHSGFEVSTLLPLTKENEIHHV